MAQRDSWSEFLHSIPMVWRILAGLAAFAGVALPFYQRLATKDEIETKVSEHNNRDLHPKPIDGVPRFPAHPRLVDDLDEHEKRIAVLEAQLEQLQKAAKASAKWRVGYAAADSERDPRRRAETAQAARIVYDDTVKGWPCPEVTLNEDGEARVSLEKCVDPETAAERALTAPRPPR